MSYRFNVLWCAGKVLLLGAFLFCYRAQAAITPTAVVRVMASNLTSGNSQTYESPGINIFKGLKPDVVAIQEFNYISKPSSDAQIRSFVDTAFGTNFVYFRESGYNIPNGIISRYPILASGSWVDSDTGVNDRGFAWARIDLPGTNDLYVVSVHLKASSGPDNESRRAAEATEITDRISTNFPPNAWIIVAGDMNLYSDTEAAITTFKTYLGDSPVPADQNGDVDTNSGRSSRYDRVLPSFSLTNKLIPVVMPSRTYTNGLVFDSRVYTPLTDVPPVVSTDSGATNMQHMGVVKDFLIPITTNSAPSITFQPENHVVVQGGTTTFHIVADGTAPLSYQWRFNTTNIAGATLNFLTLTNIQPTNAGNYSVVVTNVAGSTTSSNGTLTVLVPPTISVQPQDQLVNQGSNANFNVVAAGTAPLSYQWRFNTTNISTATTSNYTRANAQPADIGNYSVVVTNAAGSVTSSDAALYLIVPSPTLAISSASILSWPGLSNWTYTVETSTNLGATNWTTAGTATSPNGVITFTNTSTGDPERYFRVKSP